MVEEQAVILKFIVIGDYKNIELLRNTNSIAVELSKLWFGDLEIHGLKLHKPKIHEMKTGLVFYYPFQISLILLTSDVIQLTLRIALFISS